MSNSMADKLTQIAANTQLLYNTGIEQGRKDLYDEFGDALEKVENTAREYTDISVGEINKKIPNQASESNQLTDRDFVNSSINSSTARYLTYDKDGNIFPSKASLTSATQFYYNGQVTTPTKNDYVAVSSDESYDNAQTRYVYAGESGQGQWVFQYKVNNEPFTAKQNAAINSEITAELVQKIKNLVIDEILSTSSTNPVQNKVVAKALNSKADGVNGAAKNLTIAEDGGNAFIGKTIGDLKAGLAEWLTTNATVGAIRKIGAMKNLASLWNSGDDAVISLKQTTWSVTNLLYQHKGNYAQLLFSTYYSKDIYMVSYQNGVWSDMRKFAFDDEKLDKNDAEWVRKNLHIGHGYWHEESNTYQEYATFGAEGIGYLYDGVFSGLDSYNYRDLVGGVRILNGEVPLLLPTKPGALALEGKGLQFTTLAQAKPITLENSSAYLYSSSLSNAKIVGATLPEGSLLADTAFDTGFILLPKAPHTDGKYHGVAFIKFKDSLISSTGICNFTYTDADTVQIVTESGGGRLWSLSI